MSYKKFRWSRVYESSEEELIEILEARGLETQRIHVEADDAQSEQANETPITIWCAEGLCSVEIESVNTSLQSGDALSIDGDTTYVIHPGITGCAYYLSNQS